MTQMGQATRREFLERAIAVLGPLLIGQGCSEDSGDAQQSTPSDVPRVTDALAKITLPSTRILLPEILATYYWGMPSRYIRAIGFAYANLGGVAKTPEELGEALSETVHLIADEESLDAAMVRLDAQINQDFENGNIESLEGWQLARTELHLSSLSYILDV